MNAAYRTELLRRHSPWRTVERLELATLQYVWWYHHQRLHELLGYQPPDECEDTLNSTPRTCEPAIPTLAIT
ncbi:MAG: transposase [Rhodococcus sp.]|nr:transposase [Rhodococcus sp. (in: high G+C Gram-positive bacteria)]